MKYRIREPGTTIFGFTENKKKINPDRPTLDFFEILKLYYPLPIVYIKPPTHGILNSLPMVY